LETWIQVWNFSMYTHLLSFLCPKVLSAGAHISVFDEGWRFARAKLFQNLLKLPSSSYYCNRVQNTTVTLELQ
jgi:hypothetical protein